MAVHFKHTIGNIFEWQFDFAFDMFEPATFKIVFGFTPELVMRGGILNKARRGERR